MAEGLIQTARAVSEAALSTEGIHALGGGTFAEAATYEGSEKFVGVVIADDEVEVHVVANYPLVKPIPDLAKEIEGNAAPESGGRRITVVFEDIEVADDVGL
ncbi:MAG: hypothetical protein H0U65_08100 [Rubrobacter sp.]|nr:hypothetical protein [Rubrobacter sp.]